MEVAIAFPFAGLLGGNRIDECTNSTDPTCVRGAALGDAYRRYFSGDIPSLIIPVLETRGAFVSLHPLGIPVSRVIYQGILGYNKVFTNSPSIISQHDSKIVDFKTLQSTPEFQYLLSSAQVPASSSWKRFHTQIYYDQETRVAAMMFLYAGGNDLQVNTLEVAKALLDQIARKNQEEGCTAPDEEIVEMESYLNTFQSAEQSSNSSGTEGKTSPTCWVSFMFFTFQTPNLEELVQQLAMHSNPPALIHGIARRPQPLQLHVNNRTWLYLGESIRSFVGHFHYQLTLSPNTPWIENVTIHSTRSMAPVPPEIQNDVVYQQHISAIYKLQQEAIANNPVVGYTTGIAPGRVFDQRTNQNLFPCSVRPCDAGNFLADAFRYKAKADISFLTGHFTTSVGLPEGPATMSNMFEIQSLTYQLCTGVMMGVSLFRMFNYTLSVAPLSESDPNFVLAYYLPQVSGMRYVYNSEIGPSRLLGMEVWDQETENYQPMERLRLYKVATSTYVCRTLRDLSAMLGPQGLIIDGEEPFSASSATAQEVLAEMLSDWSSEENPYNATDLLRSLNDPTSKDPPMDWNRDQDDCEIGTVWVETKQTCQECPDTSRVQWSRELVEHEGVSQSSEMIQNQEDLFLLNGAPFPVAIKPKSWPSWLTIAESKKQSSMDDANIFDDADDENSQSSIVLATGEQIALKYMLSSKTLEPGTAVGTVSYGVFNRGDFPVCEGQDASFDIQLRLTPQDNLNQLGSIRWAGWVLAFIVLLAACCFGSMVISRRKDKVVRLMQPIFLVTICVGVSILGLSLVTLGFDDEIVSSAAMDAFCMATPWLLAIGFSVAFSALFAKLWRINRLFHAAHHRHMKVEAKDVVLPLAVFFALNFVVLMVWSFVDPLQWNRKAIDGDEWNTYGVCESDSAAGKSLQGVIIAINVAALVGASYQAYSARDLSDEFSESKSIGIALYSWVQLLIVAVPVLFLTNEDSVEARYFLQSGLVFAICMTMLLCIFGPIIIRNSDINDGPSTSSGTPHGAVHISGISMPSDANSRSFGRPHGSDNLGGLSSSIHSAHSYDSAVSAPMEAAPQNGRNQDDHRESNHNKNNTNSNAFGSTSEQERSSVSLPESEQSVAMPTIVEGSIESMSSMELQSSSSSLKSSLKVKPEENPSSDLRQSTLVRIDETTQENPGDIDQERSSFANDDGSAESFEAEFKENQMEGPEEVSSTTP